MVQKRHLAEDEYDVSSKHQRLDNISHSVSCLEFPLEGVPAEPFTSGKPERRSCKQSTESDSAFGALESGKITGLPICTKKDAEYPLPGSVSSSSRASSMTTDEDMRSEEAILTLEHSPVKPRRTLVQPEDMYSYLLRCPPLKEVPVGPEFQADIPEWCGNDAENVPLGSGSTEEPTPQASEANSSSAKDDDDFIGNCVIPMPKLDPAPFHGEVGRGRSTCCCENPGSISCVRQHINEARENLKRNIGHERFSELGFDDMGEVVAENWTEEEGKLFHAVVYSNPASLGKNFWDHLAEVFPSRTNQELVSYYFNVFMLRRRAEQNRCNYMDIDSDDDELHSSDDEDSCHDEVPEYDYHKQRSGFEDPVFGYFEDVGFLHGFNESTSFAETLPRKLSNSSSFDSSSQPSQKTLVDECVVDNDFHDDSCTSSDIGAMTRVSDVKSDDSNKSWDSQDFILEPPDSKSWDVGYFSCPRYNTDFLPTGSMIEEVFGVGFWNFEVRDSDKGSS